MTILRFKLILENSVEQTVYRIPENLREENSSQFPIKKVAIWRLFLAILGGTPGRTPGRGQNLGKSRFRVSCAQKIREIYEKTRGNQSLEFLGPSKNHQKTRENTRKSESLEFISSAGPSPRDSGESPLRFILI